MATVLVISPTPSHPQDAGNRARIFSLLTGLKATGHKVAFVFVKKERGGDEAEMATAWDAFFPISYQRPADSWYKQAFDKLSKILGRQSGLPYRIDDWYTTDITRSLETIRGQVQPDVVLVEYVFLSRALECFGPETLKFLDTHDILGDRHRIYLENGMPPQWFYTTVAEEQKALNRADVVIAIQDEEAAYFSRMTSKRVITVGHMVNIVAVDEELSPVKERLLFVGSHNPINVDGIGWFLDEVFTQVRQEFPGSELAVVGGCADRINQREGVILIGQVPSLLPHYLEASVVVNPVRFGTGLKIKTIEALTMGRPLVTSSAGAAGLENLAGKAFLIADSPAEFSAAIISIFRDNDLRNKLLRNAREFTGTYNQTAIQPLVESISRTGSP